MGSNRANIVIAGESNTGLTRSHNEDNFLVYTPEGGSAALAVIADGIGGHGKGETASAICCAELYRAAAATDSAGWDEKFLLNALNAANTRIFDRNLSELRSRPMGCTVVAAIFFADRLIVASAGDSRLYEYDAENPVPLRQYTVDHRPPNVRDYRRKNELSNYISRSVGTHKYVELDIKTYARPANARYLLCSDGLYSVVPDLMFSGLLSSGMTAREITGKLVRDALLGGSRDNITAICAVPENKEA